ncbi:MAG: hypothetical protein mread185_000402 [Mycoplasmataceae bacterium]|nr:MAG: hypothetical protein mread185_000402 [Mycoplasmataceae bacterium]
MTKQRIISNPSEWIITCRGDFIRIKDSESYVEKNLEIIRERLKNRHEKMVRFCARLLSKLVKKDTMIR